MKIQPAPSKLSDNKVTETLDHAPLAQALGALGHGKLERAIQAIALARQKDPKLEARKYREGVAAYKAGNYREAEFCFFVCAVCNRTNGVYLDCLRACLQASGRPFDLYVNAGFDIHEIRSFQGFARENSTFARLCDVGIDTAAALLPGGRVVKGLACSRSVLSAESLLQGKLVKKAPETPAETARHAFDTASTLTGYGATTATATAIVAGLATPFFPPAGAVALYAASTAAYAGSGTVVFKWLGFGADLAT